MALALGFLLGKDVAQERLPALDPAARALLEALGGATFGFQLRHAQPLYSLAPGACRAGLPNPDRYFFVTSAAASAAAFGGRFAGATAFFAAGFTALVGTLPPLFLGASTMISCRPSILGYCSTVLYGSRSFFTRS